MVFLITFLLLLLVPLSTATAQDGLVPCGPGTDTNCQLCHLFVLIDNVLQLVMLRIVPALAGLMLIIGGIWFFFSGASEEKKRKAKDIVTSSIIGIAIILSAWVIVNTILVQSGIVDGSLMFWYEIDCPITD